ncbi:uncharacterized protein LOC119176438 isoform X2 [Rhipicephalus microplus]|uniref:uncharacterized protein LOC119176438 isoform X2 n=1 Tax=Rhipicephalus microplus TaxID=6941 RepID=UPI003F6D3DC0
MARATQVSSPWSVGAAEGVAATRAKMAGAMQLSSPWAVGAAVTVVATRKMPLPPPGCQRWWRTTQRGCRRSCARPAATWRSCRRSISSLSEACTPRSPSCRRLSKFALFNNGMTLVDEASYQEKIAQLEEDLDKWCCHCRFLSSQLEQANNALVSLNQRLQVQEWQHQAELSEKNSIIANLQRELEWKCRTLAELEMFTRGRGGTRRMSGPAGPLAASMTSSSSLVEPCELTRAPSQRSLPAGASGKAASTSARKSSHRLPVIVRDRPANDDDDDDVVAQSSLSSETTSRSVTPRRHHTGARAASAKCLPVTVASSSFSTSSSKMKSDQAGARGTVETDRRRAQLRLPPLVDPTRALAFPARSLVHHQLTAVHCDSGLSTDEELSIDRVPSPELKPKKMGGRVVEVSTK